LPAPEQRRELPERRARPAEAAQQLDPPPAGRHEDGDRAAGLGDGAGIDAMLTRNGEVVAKGRSDAVLGNPVTAVAWLARKVDSFGVRLKAGDVVLPRIVYQGDRCAPG
jgi:hypothetical protein